MSVQAPQRVSHSRDRRIGERHPVAATLEVAMPSSGFMRRWRRPKMVITEDLSLSGAGFTCPTIDDLCVHMPVNLTLGDVTGMAVVRKVIPQSAGKTSYGVEFSDSRLGDAASSVIAARSVMPDHTPKNARPPMAASSPYWSDLADWS